MLCRYKKKGIKQYTFRNKKYKFSSDKWTSINDIRLFKALKSYPDVFETRCFFDLNSFLSIADKITFKDELIYTSSKGVARKLSKMAYIQRQAVKLETGIWIFKILNYATNDLSTYKNTKNIVNILAHRDLGGIGDIIMTTSVIEQAVKKYSNYSITYACPEQFLPLLQKNPFIIDLKPYDSTDTTQKDWDVVIDLTSDCIKHEIKNQPNVKLNRAEVFSEKCGFSIKNTPRPKIFLSENEILKAKEELKSYKLKIGLVLESNAPVRNWSGFSELKAILSKKYPDATFLEFCVKKPVEWKSNNKSHEVYGRDLRDVIALINECDVVVSPDTGLAHIAGALRVPTVWIFTHIDGKIRTKNYDNLEICQNIPDACASKGVPCWYSIPCGQGEIERKKRPLCDIAVSPESVTEKVNKILSKPNLSYCVVYKDNEEITKECISRILRFRKYNDEIVIFDNGSKNKEFLDNLLNSEQLITRMRSESNKGCIIGRNQTMKEAKGKFLLTLDNDQYISAITPHRLMNTEGDVIGVEGWSMDSGAWAFDIKENKGELAYVGGGGLLVKNEVAKDINFLDEIYAPAWFSDPDFCYKAKEKGYEITHCDNAKIEHLKHKTVFNQTDFDSQEAWKRSHKLFKEKWMARSEEKPVKEKEKPIETNTIKEKEKSSFEHDLEINQTYEDAISSPKYSVIIPYQYSEERAPILQACLKQLLESSKGELEICVHEVGQTQTLNLSNDYKYFFTKCSGFFHRSWAINKGVRELCTGNMIIFMDGDLIINKEWMNEIFSCTKTSIAWGQLSLLNEQGTKIFLKDGNINKEFIEKVKTPSKGGAAGAVMLMPKYLFELIKGLPEDFAGSWGGPDNALWAKLNALGTKINIFKSAIFHLHHSKSVPRIPSIQGKVIPMLKWNEHQWRKYIRLIGDNWGKTDGSESMIPDLENVLSAKSPELTFAMLSWLRYDKLIEILTTLSDTLTIPCNMVIRVQGAERLSDVQKQTIRDSADKFTANYVYFTYGNIGTGPCRKDLVEKALQRYPETKYINLADDDTTFTAGSVEAAIDLLDEDLSLGIVSVRYKQTVHELDTYFKPQKLFNREIKHAIEYVDCTGSATAFIRKDIFDLCSIDPVYIIGLWDLDLFLQVRSIGWKMVNYKAFDKMLAINNRSGSKEYKKSRFNREEINKSYAYFKQKWGFEETI